LNFPRIELGINATGGWGVYYRYPCRFLDRESSRCTLYHSELRPSICVHYNPYSCWYKQAVVPTVHESFLRLDTCRMSALLDHIAFDESMNIVRSPDWPVMLSMLEKLPLATDHDERFDEDAVFDRWLYEAAYGSTSAPAENRFSYTSLSNPCNGCSAACCKYLVFPHAVPTTRVAVDYLQFVLGFPGLEIGVSDESWFVIVKTTCRHLTENRCSIYGKPERPQICTFYDAHGCQYVAQFGVPRPQGFMRINLEQFFWFVEPIQFDEFGNVTYMPKTEELRRHVEDRWREEVYAEAQALKSPQPAVESANQDASTGVGGGEA
jgi:Fe-S-cluster containining protein